MKDDRSDRSAHEKWVLSNGLTLLYRRSPGVPLAAATMIFRSGSLNETPRQAGLASLTSDLLLQGTRRRSARRIAEEIEDVGASMGIQASEDYTELGFNSPVGQLNRVLDVLADVLAHPAFPQEEIKKERAQTLAALKSRKDGIFNFAYDLLNARLFPNHPYGRPVDGTRQTVAGFKREDLRRWHQAHFEPGRAILSLVASLPPPEAKRLVEKHLKIWKSGTDLPRTQAAEPLPPKRDQRHRVRGRFEQAYFMMGVPAPSVDDPDYLPLKILNTLLGGGMSSRLFMRLREDLGLAYEVSSFFTAHVYPSQWVIYLGLPENKLSLAKAELQKLLAVLQRDGPTPAEIRQAVAMIKGSYLMEHQTRRRQAWYAAWWVFLGRGPDYGRRFLEDLEDVTPEQIKLLTRRLLAQPRVTVEVIPRK